ncbi:MAG: NTP transferase domain-containing protein [Candidatus Margulisiibacteriota bacterium]
MKKAILITARLKSTRLPVKALKEICGRPMIEHMIERLKLAQKPEVIILCTSTVAQDDPLEEVAKKNGIYCYRGHPDDVLLRLTSAAEHFGIDTVISCTADNPFVDPTYIDKLVSYHQVKKHDFTKIEDLPFGTFSYALSYPAMVQACKLKKEIDTEVWGGYFTMTGKFVWGVMPVDDPELRWPELRLTVDTADDFELVTQIFKELYEPGKVFPLKQIVELLHKRPDLVAINSGVSQKQALPIKI